MHGQETSSPLQRVINLINNGFKMTFMRFSPTLIVISCFALCGLTHTAYAKDTTASGVLATLFEQAKQHDAEFAQATAEWKIKSQKLPQARANLYPNINGKINYGITDLTNKPKTPTSVNGNVTTKGYDITLTMPLYNHGAWQGLNAAKALNNSAQYNYENAQNALLIRLVSRYFDVLKAKDNLSFTQAEQTAIEEQYKIAQDSFEVGVIAQTDLLEVQAASDLAAAQLIQAENAVIVSESNLSLITHANTTVVPLPNSAKLEPLVPNDVSHWVNLAKQNNTLLKATQAKVKQERATLKAQKSQHLPSLNLIAQHKHEQRELPSNIETEQDSNALMLQLDIPIFTGGKTTSAVKEASALYTTSKTLLASQVRMTEQLTRQAFLGVNASLAQINALKKALESSKASEQAVQDGFDAGTRTSVDILNAKRDRLRTERNLQTAQYNYWLNKLRLQHITGTLSVNDLPI